MPQQYPFTAVVGSDDMALALLLTTIDPAIGGVLVRGEKGTAKSTIVRALADVLPPIDVVAGDRFSSDPRDPSPLSPDAPFAADAGVETRPVRIVELPVGATEDRVLGSLHLQKALEGGRVEYEPGLLARAHRGVLYVDEVNLLHDHLVDVLLDAAAMGRATIERDGVSIEHAARFVLVGTMNPEEGELRPQLLDRFGLTVEVAAPREADLRAEVVRRRLAFDADPVAFGERWAAAQDELTTRIVAAQAALPEVELTDAALVRIAEVCAAFDVDGLRADIVMARTAAANAAWEGRTSVTTDDLRVAARLALPHRRRRNPFDAPGIDEDQLDDALGDEPLDDGPDGPDDDPDRGGGSDPAPPSDAGPDDGEASTSPADHASDATPPSEPEPAEGSPGPSSASTVASTAGDPYRTRLFAVSGTGEGEAGRRSRAVTSRGRRVGARTAEGGGSGSIDLLQTIRAAAPHQASRTPGGGAGPWAAEQHDSTRLKLHRDDLRLAVREGLESNLVLFCVDASGSMAARRRMEQVKTAILSLLLDAYQRRDKVGLVTFRADTAELALPPTGSVDVAARRLDELPAGGRTPLAEGLERVAEVLRVERVRDPRRRPLVVVVTDGRATSGTDALARSHRAAGLLADVDTLVVDCESGRFTMGLARTLAEHLRADYVALGEVTADALTDAVEGQVALRAPIRQSERAVPPARGPERGTA